MNEEAGITASPTERNTKWTKNQKIVFWSLIVGEFLVNSCLSIPAPFLPKEVSHKPRFLILSLIKEIHLTTIITMVTSNLLFNPIGLSFSYTSSLLW